MFQPRTGLEHRNHVCSNLEQGWGSLVLRTLSLRLRTTQVATLSLVRISFLLQLATFATKVIIVTEMLTELLLTKVAQFTGTF